MSRVINSDANIFMDDMEKDSIDLIITDPPYKDYQSCLGVQKCKKIVKNEFTFETLIGHIERILKSGCHFYLWCDALTYADAFNCIKNSKSLKYKNMLIWVKNHHGAGDLFGGYAHQHEICIFGTKGKGNKFQVGNKRISDVLLKKRDDGTIGYYHKIPPKFGGHPTIKPVELLKLFINRSSEIGDMVFDPYSGSFSTMKASIELGRECIGVELDSEYCKLAPEINK